MTLLFNQQSAILSPFSIPTCALVMMAAAFTAALDSYREDIEELSAVNTFLTIMRIF